MKPALVIAGDELRQALEGELGSPADKMKHRSAALRKLVTVLAKIAPDAQFTPMSASLSIAVAAEDVATIQKLHSFFAANPEKGSLVNDAVTTAIF